MADLKEIQIQPGLYTLATARANQNRWNDGSNVRFRFGMAQKIGGWLKNAAGQFLGICRGMFSWYSNNSQFYVAMGTTQRLYVLGAGTLSNITPYDETGTLANPFSTTNGSPSVNVHDVAHNRSVGAIVSFSGAAAVGGLTISGEYTVTTVVDVDNYTITAASNATSTAGPGGGAAVAFNYELNPGPADAQPGSGWGAGTWGSGTWGSARTSSSVTRKVRTWTFDNFGEDLLANPRGGKIYLWDTSSGVGSRAAVIAAAPATCRQIMVSPDNRQAIAFGCTDSGGTDQPKLIRWSDIGDYTTWTPTTTNAAGTKYLDVGSEFMTAVKAKGEIVVFTDDAIYGMTFIGPPFYFDTELRDGEVGCISPLAACFANERVYFMSLRNFHTYDGAAARVLPCDIYDDVFGDINYVQRSKFFVGINYVFSELWFFYVSAAGSEIDRCAIFNWEEQHWTKATVVRTAWEAKGNEENLPLAAGADGYAYTHESGQNDDTSPLAWNLRSHDFEMGEGDYLYHVNRIVPDFKDMNATVQMQLAAKKYPQDAAYKYSASKTITPTTKLVKVRIRGRQINIAMSGSSLNDYWRLSTLRSDAKPHGSR